MSEGRKKQKQNPSYKGKGSEIVLVGRQPTSPPDLWRVTAERRTRVCFCPLTPAVVVIHGMTACKMLRDLYGSARGGVRSVACCVLAEPCSLGHEVIPFGDTCRASGANPVVGDGGLMVAGHFQQMGANCVQTIVAGQPVVSVERSEQFQALGWAVHHGRCNCLIERHHGVVGHAVQ